MRKLGAGVMTAAIVAATISTALPSANALTQGCSASGGALNAQDRMAVAYFGSTVDTSAFAYNLAPNPGDDRRFKNNVNLTWTGGGSFNSGDTAIRDAAWHSLNGPTHITGTAFALNITWNNIFNTSAQPDPHCGLTMSV